MSRSIKLPKENRKMKLEIYNSLNANQISKEIANLNPKNLTHH